MQRPMRVEKITKIYKKEYMENNNILNIANNFANNISISPR